MELPGQNLRHHRDQKDRGEHERAFQVTQIHGDGDGIAAGFAQCGPENLHQPERKANGGNLAQARLAGFLCLLRSFHLSPPNATLCRRMLGEH